LEAYINLAVNKEKEREGIIEKEKLTFCKHIHTYLLVVKRVRD
jgi:hypothetical protein